MPFIRIRKVSPKDALLVYESLPCEESRNPVFHGIQMTESKLCDNNPSLLLVC